MYVAISNVICGFQLDVKRVTEEVTQYNQNTGEAYLADKFLHMVGFVGGKELFKTNDEVFYDDESYVEGFKIFELNDKYVIGLVVAESQSDSVIREFVPVVPDVVANFAKETGIEPKWFVLSILS